MTTYNVTLRTFAGVVVQAADADEAKRLAWTAVDLGMTTGYDAEVAELKTSSDVQQALNTMAALQRKPKSNQPTKERK